MKDDYSQIRTIMGNYYGYPACCVEAFEREDHTTRPTRKLSGTGYVPCEACNDKYTEAELIANIDANRVMKSPTFLSLIHISEPTRPY